VVLFCILGKKASRPCQSGRFTVPEILKASGVKCSPDTLKDIPLPVLVINFKNYRETLSEEGIQLARSIQAAALEARASAVIAPSPAMLYSVLSETRLPVFSQNVDATKAENSTGYVTPSVLKTLGCAGSILNHSEHRLAVEQIRDSIALLKGSSLRSLVCARDAEEAGEFASLDPDFIAVEPPELIGSGRAVSKVSPEVVIGAVDAIRKVNPRTVPLCGAGIVDGADVSASLRLGAKGALVSSGLVKNANPYEKALELMKSLAL
jgi:triosephosphate isomerase